MIASSLGVQYDGRRKPLPGSPDTQTIAKGSHPCGPTSGKVSWKALYVHPWMVVVDRRKWNQRNQL